MMDADDTHRYDDIINLPHPDPRHHPRMPMEKRAAQFSPFAALTGHEDAIHETARLTDKKMELDEYMKAILDYKLQEINERKDPHREVSFTWFQRDRKKAGGRYTVSTCAVKKIDGVFRKIILMDGQEIFIDDIRWIEAD